MANVVLTNVIQPLERLVLSAYSNRLKLYFQRVYETRGSAFLGIRLLTDTEESRFGFASTYTYQFEVKYYEQAGQETRASMERITAAVETFKDLIATNRSLFESGTYRWHEAVLGECRYEPELTEEEAANPGLVVVAMDLTVSVTVAI